MFGRRGEHCACLAYVMEFGSLLNMMAYFGFDLDFFFGVSKTCVNKDYIFR